MFIVIVILAVIVAFCGGFLAGAWALTVALKRGRLDERLEDYGLYRTGKRQ